MIKLCPRNYLVDIYHCAKFHCNSFTGSLPPNVKYYAFVTYFIVLSSAVLSWLYYFFLQLHPGQTRGRILTFYGLNDASSPEDVPFRGLDDDPQFKWFNPPKKTPKKGAWLGNFQPNWQNNKIAISPAGKIGSTPKLDTVIEPHS